MLSTHVKIFDTVFSHVIEHLDSLRLNEVTHPRSKAFGFSDAAVLNF